LASLLLVPVLRSRVARAAGDDAKLVMLYYGNGASESIDRIFPRKTSAGWDWSACPLTNSLSPHESYLSIVRGLRINGGGYPDQIHQTGMLAWTTGDSGILGYPRRASGFYESGHASVDHWFGQATGTSSLVLGVTPAKNEDLSTSRAGPTTFNPVLYDPQQAYIHVFGSIMPSTGDDTDRQLERRLSVLDVVLQDLRDAERRFGLSLEERERLQRYEAALDQVETRLRAQRDDLTSGGGLPPSPAETASSPVPERTRALLDIAIAALALGGQRSVMFQFSSGYDDSIDYSAFVPGASTAHHASQHRDTGSVPGDPKLVTKWIHEQLSYLLTGMRSVTEASGANLLDNSAVMMGTCTPVGIAEPGDISDHRLDSDHPTFVFGKAAGALRGDVEVGGGTRNYVDLIATVAEGLAADAGVANPYTRRNGFSSLVSELMS
jgi:hypothetical protein